MTTFGKWMKAVTGIGAAVATTCGTIAGVMPVAPWFLVAAAAAGGVSAIAGYLVLAVEDGKLPEALATGTAGVIPKKIEVSEGTEYK